MSSLVAKGRTPKETLKERSPASIAELGQTIAHGTELAEFINVRIFIIIFKINEALLSFIINAIIRQTDSFCRQYR